MASKLELFERTEVELLTDWVLLVYEVQGFSPLREYTFKRADGFAFRIYCNPRNGPSWSCEFLSPCCESILVGPSDSGLTSCVSCSAKHDLGPANIFLSTFASSQEPLTDEGFETLVSFCVPLLQTWGEDTLRTYYLIPEVLAAARPYLDPLEDS